MAVVWTSRLLASEPWLLLPSQVQIRTQIAHCPQASQPRPKLSSQSVHKWLLHGHPAFIGILTGLQRLVQKGMQNHTVQFSPFRQEETWNPMNSSPPPGHTSLSWDGNRSWTWLAREKASISLGVRSERETCFTAMGWEDPESEVPEEPQMGPLWVEDMRRSSRYRYHGVGTLLTASLPPCDSWELPCCSSLAWGLKGDVQFTRGDSVLWLESPSSIKCKYPWIRGDIMGEWKTGFCYSTSSTAPFWETLQHLQTGSQDTLSVGTSRAVRIQR